MLSFEFSICFFHFSVVPEQDTASGCSPVRTASRGRRFTHARGPTTNARASPERARLGRGATAAQARHRLRRLFHQAPSCPATLRLSGTATRAGGQHASPARLRSTASAVPPALRALLHALRSRGPAALSAGNYIARPGGGACRAFLEKHSLCTRALLLRASGPEVGGRRWERRTTRCCNPWLPARPGLCLACASHARGQQAPLLLRVPVLRYLLLDHLHDRLLRASLELLELFGYVLLQVPVCLLGGPPG